MISKMKKYSVYILPVAFLCVLFMAFMVFWRDGIFMFSGDSYEQVYQFYVGGYTKFFSGELFSYDFSTNFGQNPFYHSYYFLFSPFFYGSLLFPKAHLEYSFLWMTCLKLIVFYACSVLWLKKLSDNKIFVVCFSLLFTFSGWVFFYSNYIFFLDHLFVLPLILQGVESYLNNNKSRLLVLSVAYIAVANYYFAYLFLAISCFYGLCRAISLKKNLFKMAAGFLVRVLLGLAIAAVVFVPNIYVVLNSPRLGADVDLSLMNKYELFKFVSGFFIPTTFRFDSGLLVSQQWTRYLGWGNGTNAYMGVLTVFSLFLFLFSKKNWKSLCVFAFLMLGIVFYVCPIFSIMFQGTLDTRWFLYFHVFFCLLFSELFENSFSKKQILIASVLSILSFAGLIGLSVFYGLSDREALIQCCLIFAVFVLFAACYCMVWMSNKKHLLIWLTCAEIIFSGVCFFSSNETLETTWFLDEYTDSEAFKRYDDGSFYRILQDGYDYWPSNNAYAKDIHGVSFYSSIYNAEMDEYLSRFKTTWSMPVAPGQDLAYSLVGAKYWVTKAFHYSEPYGYVFLENTDDFTVYQNEHYVELGFGSTQTLNKKAIENCSYLMQDLIMQNVLITETSDNMDYEITGIRKGYDATVVSDAWLYSSPDGKDKAICDTVLVVENQHSNDLIVELYFYGNLVNSYTYYERPYFTIPLAETDYVTDIRFVNLNDHAADVSTSLIDREFLDASYERRKENSFTKTSVSNNQIRGEIELDEAMMVYVSIPYDKGWSVWVDGEKSEFEKVNLGFIGFHVSEGVHQVEMKYEVPFVKEGAFISIIALISCLLYLKKDMLKNRKCLN